MRRRSRCTSLLLLRFFAGNVEFGAAVFGEEIEDSVDGVVAVVVDGGGFFGACGVEFDRWEVLEFEAAVEKKSST